MLAATKAGVLKGAMALLEADEKQYNPDNLKVGDFELRWNQTIESWEIIKKKEQAIEPPIPFEEKIKFTRGMFFKAEKPIIDETTGLEVVMLGRGNRKFYHPRKGEPVRIDRTSYFKITYQDRSFFVKKSTATNNPGYAEYTNTIKAKDALKDLPFVKTIEAQLGYRDTNQSWFISLWETLEDSGYIPYVWNLGSGYDDYGRTVGNPACLAIMRDEKLSDEALEEHGKEETEMKEKVKKIEAALLAAGMAVYDLDKNLFYNWETKQFVLLDVSVAPSDTISQNPQSP